MNKVALVTGGSRNIGKGIAVVLARHGYDMAITYHNRRNGAEEVQRQIERLGRRCIILQANLEEPKAPQRAVTAVYEAYGRIDLAVCNAGRDFRSSILTITSEELDMIFAANFKNYMLTAGAAARYMVKDKVKGNIIFITSSHAERAYPDDFFYGGIKAAMKRACESIALDLSHYNIRVNCIAPGAVWPPDIADLENHLFLKNTIPLRRSGTPEDIGEAVAFLASDEASYITGISLRIDGGLILPGFPEGEETIRWNSEDWRQQMYEKAMKLLV